MFNYALIDDSGRIHQSGSAPNKAEAHRQADQFPELIMIECEAKFGLHYFKSGEVKTYPEMPIGLFEFDHEAEMWVDVTTPEQAEAQFRQQRNALLAASDWTQVADAPVDQAAWAAYRQALRDLPVNTADFSNVTWPVAP